MAADISKFNEFELIHMTYEEKFDYILSIFDKRDFPYEVDYRTIVNDGAR